MSCAQHSPNNNCLYSIPQTCNYMNFELRIKIYSYCDILRLQTNAQKYVNRTKIIYLSKNSSIKKEQFSSRLESMIQLYPHLTKYSMRSDSHLRLIYVFRNLSPKTASYLTRQFHFVDSSGRKSSSTYGLTKIWMQLFL